MTKQEFQRILNEVKTGTRYEANLMKGVYIEGKIYMSKTKFYLCHNSPEASGSIAPDRLGYKRSWVVSDTNCSSTLKSIKIFENNYEIINNYSIF